MSEGVLYPSSADVAWVAARAANDAFDTIKETEADITKVQEVARLAVAGISINGEAVKALEQERNKAEIDFGLLVDMAGVVMYQPDDGDANESPWSALTTSQASEIEPSVLPEIDCETAEKLETLRSDYRERVVRRYTHEYQTVANYIQRGLLPETYRLPELSDLMDRIAAVAPTFEHLQQQAGRQK